MEKIHLQHLPSPPITVNQGKKPSAHLISGRSFAHHLQTAIHQTNELTLSKHAQKRLQERAINIDPEAWGKVEEKVHEAKKLGITDSLVLLKDAALIVSAKNNTVITAMNRNEATSQIFTNINGTIVLE